MYWKSGKLTVDELESKIVEINKKYGIEYKIDKEVFVKKNSKEGYKE